MSYLVRLGAVAAGLPSCRRALLRCATMAAAKLVANPNLLNKLPRSVRQDVGVALIPFPSSADLPAASCAVYPPTTPRSRPGWVGV